MVAEWYYRSSIGGAEGPVTAAHLKQLTQLGRIGPETEIKKGADGRWITANKVKGLLDVAPPKSTATKTALPAWTQPLEAGAEPEATRPRPNSPAPLVRRPPAEAEPDDEDYRPLPARRTASSDVVDAEYTVTSSAKMRSPILLVGAGVGGTLLVAGLVAVAFTIVGKKDENRPQQQSVVQNEKQKDETQNGEPPSTRNNPPEAVGTAAAPSLSTPETTVKGYLAAGAWEERLPYVLNADQVRPEMAKIYRDTPRFKPEIFLPGTIVAVENRNAQVGGKCTVTVDVSTSSPDVPRWTYILVRTVDGFKVDWEASQVQSKKQQNEALQAKLRELNPVIDIEVLRCKQSNSRTEIEFRLTNKSTALFPYVAVTMSIHNAKGDYLGSNYTNETNVRAGQSIVESISFDNVKVREVASWKMGIKDVTIDRGDGQRVAATSVFKLNEQLAGSEKGHQRKLESRLEGHWQGQRLKWHYYFSSTKPEVIIIDNDGVRLECTVSVVERNYSTGTVQLRFVITKPKVNGFQQTFTFKEKTSVSMQSTHAFKGNDWIELPETLKAQWFDDLTYVDKVETP